MSLGGTPNVNCDEKEAGLESRPKKSKTKKRKTVPHTPSNSRHISRLVLAIGRATVFFSGSMSLRGPMINREHSACSLNLPVKPPAEILLILRTYLWISAALATFSPTFSVAVVTFTVVILSHSGSPSLFVTPRLVVLHRRCSVGPSI